MFGEFVVVRQMSIDQNFELPFGDAEADGSKLFIIVKMNVLHPYGTEWNGKIVFVGLSMISFSILFI